jgi:hypothetical protein
MKQKGEKEKKARPENLYKRTEMNEERRMLRRMSH